MPRPFTMPRVHTVGQRDWFEVRASADGGDAEIYIYGPIGKSWWDDTATDAAGLIAELAELSDRHIALHINSLGGDAFEGQAIHNALRRHPGGVTTYIDGICASAATFAALAAGKVVMAANAIFMIHKAWTWGIGNADEMRGTAAILDKIDLAQVAVYRAKTGMSEDELLTIMADRDEQALGWFTAEEALAKGFIDQIGDDVTPAASAQAHSVREFAASGATFVPERFAAALGIPVGSVKAEGRRNSEQDAETLREVQALLVDAHDRIGEVLGDGEDDVEERGTGAAADTPRIVGAEVAALLTSSPFGEEQVDG